MYIPQVRHVFSNHNLEKANGMDEKYLTAEKKRCIYKINRVKPGV